jgi:hypothetical protein
MAPSGIHPLLFKREFWLLLDLRLCCGISLRPLGFTTGSTSSLCVCGPALLPLMATTIVSSVVGIAVGAPLLFLCNSALSVRNVWASTGHAPREITAITLRVTRTVCRQPKAALTRSLIMTLPVMTFIVHSRLSLFFNPTQSLLMSLLFFSITVVSVLVRHI